MEKANGLLNLLLSVPVDVRNRLVDYTGKEDVLSGMIEVIILLGSEIEVAKQKIIALGATFEDMGFGFAIITVDVTKLNDLASIPEIQYLELPKTLYTTDYYTNRDSCIIEAQNTYGLTGKGILIGIIDSGIDYTNAAFRNTDGTTRIEFIYEPGNNKTVYTKEKINEALKSPNPYSVVPHIDDSGHGTFVTGIACAGGNIDTRNKGVAPESSIGVVKMTIPGRANNAQSTQLMRGIRYLIDRSRELEIPLSINLSFSTNMGNHKGESLIEQYIDTVCNLERFSMTVAAGNEGNSGHHVGGELQIEELIDINISSVERTVVFQFYKNILDNVSLEITNPQNFKSSLIQLNTGYYQGGIGADRYYIYNTGPAPLSKNGEITIALAGNDYLVSGVWRLRIVTPNAEGRRYDMWLPISESIDTNTKFLNPNPYNTLGIPATVERVISVGAYNSNTNILAAFSGRGDKIGIPSKPDVVAPGIDVLSTLVGGGYGSESGTSMAAPHVAGAAALLLQWGMVLGNDPLLYGERLKAYILKGAGRDRSELVYPNAEWGYGTLCLADTIEEILKDSQGAVTRDEGGSLYRESPNAQANVGATNGAAAQITGDNTGLNNNGGNSLETQPITLINQSTGLNSPGGSEVLGTVGYEALPQTRNFAKSYVDNNYSDILIQYEGDVIGAINDIEGAEVLVLDERTAILTVIIEKLNDIIASTREIVYITTIALYTQTDIQPVDAAEITRFHTSDLLNIRGGGTIIGIIDSGIDYINREFINEDDTSRIVSIWDQTIQSENPERVYGYGTEYTKADLNNAIAANKAGQDPYTIVPSKDTVGHGTAMASIAGARGYNPEIVGAAPDCEFAIVKLKEAKTNDKLLQYGNIPVDMPVYAEPDVITAIRYLNNVAFREEKPLTILLPIGSNKGSHNDNGIIETNINSISERRGFALVSSVGNEGDTSTHTSGILSAPGSSAKLEVALNALQRNMRFYIYIEKPAKVTLSITSPSGDYVNKISFKYREPQTVNFIIEGTTARVTYFLPEELTGEEVIRVDLENIATGTWVFTLDAVDAMNSRYDSWLPQKALLIPGTQFLNPKVETTLMEPSNASHAISVGYYNQNNDTLVAASGRGYTRDNLIKPDIIAGGVEAKVISANNEIQTITGASVATAVVAGATSLLFEWGIIKGKDPTMFVEKIKSYFASGADKRRGSIYPNPIEGYGELNLFKTFESIRGKNITEDRRSSNDEFYLERTIEETFNKDEVSQYKRIDIRTLLE